MLGMAFTMEEYESSNPLNIGLFRANRVVFFADYFADLVEKSHGVPLSVSLLSYSAPAID